MDMQNIENEFTELKSQLAALDKKIAEDKLSMVVFSGDLDKIIAAFVIATGAVAMGMEAVMFFTFWGTPVLRDAKKSVGGKDTFGKMFGAMLPKGLGFKREEMIDYKNLTFCGVAKFLEEAANSKVQLFI